MVFLLLSCRLVDQFGFRVIPAVPAHDPVAAGQAGEVIVPELFHRHVLTGPVGKDVIVRVSQAKVVAEDRLTAAATINPGPGLDLFVSPLIVASRAFHDRLLQSPVPLGVAVKKEVVVDAVQHRHPLAAEIQPVEHHRLVLPKRGFI